MPRVFGLAFALLLPLALALADQSYAAARVPTGFRDSLVAPITSATALAFTPDGRILVTSQSGRLWIIGDAARPTALALDLRGRVCSTVERGMVGVAVDPSFAANHRIYLFYTYKNRGDCSGVAPRPVNRVSRFVLRDDNVVARGSEVVLIDNIPSPTDMHIAGDLQFGKDGYLYVSVGDGGCDYAADSGCMARNDAANDQHVLLGKILRITAGGAIPHTNPFRGPGSARCHKSGRTESSLKCQETFATGLRNPFRIAFDPAARSSRFFINDVGQDTWEEINVGGAGADYDWNRCEGRHVIKSLTPCAPTSSNNRRPIYSYSHDTGCESITGAAFVPAGAWPVSFHGTYLFADWMCGKIFQLRRAPDGAYSRSLFAVVDKQGPVSLKFDPYGVHRDLFYTTLAGGGALRRITYIGQ